MTPKIQKKKTENERTTPRGGNLQQANQSQEKPQQHNGQDVQAQEGNSKRRRSIADEGSREERTHSMITRSTVQKRPRESVDEEFPEAKHHRAFICMMKDLDPNMDWADELLECVGEVAFPALAPGIAQRQEVPIPRTYQEAIQDPKWGHMWEEAIQKELTESQSSEASFSSVGHQFLG